MRRDLRIFDNHALSLATESKYPVLLLFIFDEDILETLPHDDHRVSFIHENLSKINRELSEKYSSGIIAQKGKVQNIFEKILEKYDVQELYFNHDYEPSASSRDEKITKFFQEKNIPAISTKDQVIFERCDITKNDGEPYTVYTPYSKKWIEKISAKNTEEKKVQNNFFKGNFSIPSLEEIGFTQSNKKVREIHLDENFIEKYEESRNIPSLENGTSHLSVHLRFGTVSVREIVKRARGADNITFLKELIWREFFMQLLYHFPNTINQEFKEKYFGIPWRNNEKDFKAWKNGQTGFPLVDAGMRELKQSGYMHNRVRMLCASFLCKHLLIDWRLGERYFAEKLFDYEQSSNTGNWQWAAGCGADAAPYFRIFNPHTQLEKFDPNGDYIKKWLPEFSGLGYVQEIVDHKMARERALETYKTHLEKYEQK